MDRRYDVAIAGGGPAGCATALALARNGVTNILLTHSPRAEGRRIGESIPPDTRLLLDRLGVLERFLEQGHDPCLGSCSSWGADDLGYNDFVFNPLGNGWHLDRRRFDAMLLEEVAARGVEVRDGSFDVQRPPHARFIVDATGPAAAVARSRGARRVVVDGLICVSAFMIMSDTAPLSRLTMLEAVADGWWYAARVPNGEVVVAFASDTETIRRLDATRPANWRRLLAMTRHVARALDGCVPADESLLCNHAPSFMLDRCAGEDWLAAGDAASAHDPISAAGIYKALDDGLRAAEALTEALSGNALALEAYHAGVAERFEQYLANRHYFYSLERRFPDSRFWTTRSAAALTPSAQ